jgi:hypothetical protein
MIRDSHAPMMVPMYPTGENIQAGHWIKGMVPTAGGVWHHGIIRNFIHTADGWYVEVIHNVKSGGVIVSSLENFSDGPIFLMGRPSSPEHMTLILATADANLGKPYFLFSQNGEHFCTFCYTWQKKSESINGIMKFTLVLAGAVALGVCARESS